MKERRALRIGAFAVGAAGYGMLFILMGWKVTFAVWLIETSRMIESYIDIEGKR